MSLIFHFVFNILLGAPFIFDVFAFFRSRASFTSEKPPFAPPFEDRPARFPGAEHSARADPLSDFT